MFVKHLAFVHGTFSVVGCVGSLGDAFQWSWITELFNPFLPLPLLIRVLEKARREGSGIILVAPFWPCQILFQTLMEMSQKRYVPLPKQKDWISLGEVFHCGLELLSLTVWKTGNFPPQSQFIPKVMSKFHLSQEVILLIYFSYTRI